MGPESEAEVTWGPNELERRFADIATSRKWSRETMAHLFMEFREELVQLVRDANEKNRVHHPNQSDSWMWTLFESLRDTKFDPDRKREP